MNQVELEKLIAKGKIRRESVPIIMEFTQAGYVFHHAWGVGKVKNLNALFSQIIVDFDGKPGHRMDLEFAAKILKAATVDDNYSLLPVSSERLSWKLLPSGELNIEFLNQCVRNAADRLLKRLSFDIIRLEFLLNLRPTRIYTGVDEFDGYFAFLFSTLKGAVLENPIEGNAVYIFNENWKELSKLSKSELFRQEQHQFRRVVHTGGWQGRLKETVLKG